VEDKAMASEINRHDNQIFEKALRESWGELSSVNPVILSCGGIYIPHQGEARRISYHILTTPNEMEPVKVVTGIKPRNILLKVLAKESMN
jgi:hypothetical protein